MSEPGPVSFSLLGAAVALAGPVLGPYALIVFAAGIGAGLALSVEAPASRWAGFRFWLLATVIALLLTGPVLWAVSTYTHVPANVALVPVALVLGACRNQVLAIIRKALDTVPAVFSAALEKAGLTRGDGR